MKSVNKVILTGTRYTTGASREGTRHKIFLLSAGTILAFPQCNSFLTVFSVLRD
jgi:hypothetical protein